MSFITTISYLSAPWISILISLAILLTSRQMLKIARRQELRDVQQEQPKEQKRDSIE